MRIIVAILLTATFLGGCADSTALEPQTPASEDEVKDTNSTIEDTLDSFLLLVTLDNATFDVGAPINFTLETDLSDSDALNATWTIDVIAGNVTDNATANLTLEGVGLPASGNITGLEAGNYTLVASAALAGYETALESLEISIIDAFVDPCLGAAVQEPLSFSGTNLAPTQSTDHEFEVLPCQTKIVAKFTAGGGDVDSDWAIYDPTGAERDGAASFTPRGENDLVVEGDIQAGVWTITVENWAGAASMYDVDVTFE